MDQSPTRLEDQVETLAQGLDADIVHFNGFISRGADIDLIRQCISRKRRKNVILLLVTFGGDPDAAFRIARCLQGKYEKFYLYVTGPCKSAGTLVALGAHELIFSDFGEPGPLDVQMSKKDEIFEQQSGLTVMDAITTLNEKAYAAFNEFFLETKGGPGSITMHSAAEIATQLTTGLFAGLYSQIDPMHVGEAGRAMKIADRYGIRLLDCSKNMSKEALDFLNVQYPHHGFVIDRAEAELLFVNVRGPTDDEFLLAELLDGTRNVVFGKPKVRYLNQEVSTAVSEDDQAEQPEGDEPQDVSPESGEVDQGGHEETANQPDNVAQIGD